MQSLEITPATRSGSRARRLVRTCLFFALPFALLAFPARVLAFCELAVGSGEVIVNFDLTSQDPSPPYTSIRFGATFDVGDRRQLA